MLEVLDAEQRRAAFNRPLAERVARRDELIHERQKRGKKVNPLGAVKDEGLTTLARSMVLRSGTCV